MILSWQNQAWEDYLYWQKTDKSKLKRINELIKSCLRTPLEGIGNTESLKHDLQGFWSRRIDSEHRLVYTFQNKNIIIVSCRYHY
ncbi:Txe/YoeB family addiction module toxin [Flavobacterium sp.]|jgi:toxin YoeB|uniref:Txe/YoeB family addiction module toxin n=1 Tax=Flavobacterium sp. TaxID=239 RepID=UPI0037BFD371